MGNSAPIKGFVVRDQTDFGPGVVPIIPANHAKFNAEAMAWDYIRKNKVLQTFYAEADEDLFDFTLRVNAAADDWRAHPERWQA